MTCDGLNTTGTADRPLVRRAGLLVAAGLAVVVLVGGCSGGTRSSNKGGVNTVASTQSPATFAGGSPTPVDSDTPASTVPTTVADPNLPGDPLSYASKLFADWKSQDQAGAATLATPATV